MTDKFTVYTLNVETFLDKHLELIHDHYDEVPMGSRRFELDLDYDLYYALEASGNLKIYMMGDDVTEAEAQGGKVSSDLRNGMLISSFSYDTPPLELDIRGRTIEGALEELEKRLDAAFLAGMPLVRIIHGKGTGKLRQAVRQELKNNAYVSSFEPGHQSEGGDGVTRVKLAIS